MKKATAISHFGSVAATAKAIGISYQAVAKWPEDLPPAIEDRVIAAIARRTLPPSAFAPPQPQQAAEVVNG